MKADGPRPVDSGQNWPDGGPDLASLGEMGDLPEPTPSERIVERMRLRGLLPDSHPSQPWLHTWFHILRIAGILFVATNLVTGTLYALTDAAFDPLSATGMFLVLVSQLAILADLHQPGPERHAVAAVVFTLAGLLLTEWPNAGNASPSGDWWQMLFLITALLYSAGRFQGALRWGLLAAVVLVHGGMRLWEWRQGADFSTHAYFDRYAIELGQLVMIGASVVIAFWAGARGARTVDLGLEQERRRRAEEALARQSVFQDREADRFIHDAVLHTLRLVALDRSVVPARTAVRACRMLAAQLREPDPEAVGGGGLRARLEAVVDELESRLNVEIFGKEVHLPADVEEAFVRAVSEALRNVARHAQTNAARVLVSRSGPRVVVTVSDAGVGFDPGKTRHGRGVGQSILQRMSDVGGIAWATSRVGRGTIVRLEWEPRGPGVRRPWLRATYGSAAGVFRAILFVASPLVVHNLWAALLPGHHLAVPWVGWVASLAVLAVYVWGARRGVQRGLGFWESLTVTLTAWGATVLNALVLPEGAPTSSLFWMAGGAMPLALLQALFRPRRAAVVTTAGMFLIVLAVTLFGHGALSGSTEGLGSAMLSSLPLLLIPVVGLLTLAGVRFILEHAAERALMSHETSVRTFDAVLLHEAERQALQDRIERRAEAVIDFVMAVAGQRLDPSDPRVRAQADELERAVRAETSGAAASGERAPELDDELDRLRSEGVDVTVRSSGELAPAVGDWLVRLLSGLEPDDVTFVRATILPAGEDGTWRVATVLRPDSAGMLKYVQGLSTTATVEDGQVHVEHYVPETTP